MKTVLNNRDLRIKEVENICKLTGASNQKEMVVNVSKFILENKVNNSKRNFKVGSNNHIRSIVDAYERALASVNMYCFKNNIPSDIGYLYLITSETHKGFVKIGYTSDVEARLLQYQTYSPFRDFSIFRYVICEKAREVEKIVLEEFKEYSVSGEWFMVGDLNLLFSDICKVMDDNGFPNRFNYNSLR